MAFALFVNGSPGLAALEHVVAPGDTLSALASRYGATVEELAEINRIADPNLIFVGDALQIPDASTTVASVPKALPPPSATAPVHAPTAIPPPPPIPELSADDASASTQSPPAKQPPVPPTIAPPTAQSPETLASQPAAPTPTSSPPPAPDPQDADGDGQDDNAEWSPYAIRAGDWLSSIAERYDTTVEELARVNSLSNTNLIYAGQVILVPASRTESNPTDAALSPTAGMTVEQRLDYWASRYNVPPEMIKALTWWESGWNNNAISSAGAIGIGQLLPSTADFVADVLIGEELNPYAVDDNIRMTARFVRYLLDETSNDRRLTLASYYQGLFAVRRYGIYNISIPYVNGILALQDRFR